MARGTGSEGRSAVGDRFAELISILGGQRYRVSTHIKVTGSEGSLAGWGQIGPIVALILHLV